MTFISIDLIVRRRVRWFLGLFTAFVLCLPLAANAQGGGILVISEFRNFGQNGAADEFIEIYNNSAPTTQSPPPAGRATASQRPTA